MFHRESGVFKTSYVADMAVYPLPIAKWTVAALTALFVVVVPLAMSEYYLSILNLILIAVVGNGVDECRVTVQRLEETLRFRLGGACRDECRDAGGEQRRHSKVALPLLPEHARNALRVRTGCCRVCARSLICRHDRNASLMSGKVAQSVAA